MAKGKAKGGGGGEEEQQQKVQAVLLADSFNNNFRPISYEMPKVLCPLVNVPMIDYTLEFLSSNGVEEVFVFCVNQADKLSKYLAESRWGEHMDVKCITSSNCLSAGDALRELDRLGIIHADPFVLIHGDVVSNIDLKSLLQEHKEAKKKDSSKIMTMCFAKAAPSSRLRPVMNDLVVALDKSTKQIVLFNNSLTESGAELPPSVFEEHAQVEYHSDLLDLYIDVCSPEVLVLISDNFDYQDLRQHFVTNEVANMEMGNKISAHITGPNEYSVRVEDIRLYDTVSRDIIRRWTYPLVPDNSATGGGGGAAAYLASRGCIYRHRGLTLPRSVTLGKGTVIGAGVKIGEETTISNSVIGPGCSVGERVEIVGSYIWEGAQIGAGAKVEGAVIAHNAIVKEKAVITKGCVLGAGVVVGAGVKLPPFTRLTCVKAVHSEGLDWGDDEARGGVTDSDSSAEDGETDTSVVGPDGKGHVWRVNGDDEGYGSDSETAGLQGLDPIVCRSIWCTAEEQWAANRWSEFEQEEDESGYRDDTDPDNLMDARDIRANSKADNMQSKGGQDISFNTFTDSGGLSGAVNKVDIDFHRVIKDLIVTGHDEGHPVDNLLLEIKGYKFAQNRTFAECINATVEAILDLAGCGTPGCAKGMPLVSAVRSQLQTWKPLLSRLAQDPKDELEMIKAVEYHALQANNNLAAVFRFVLQLLYDMELVSEEGMQEWIEARRNMPKSAPELTLFNAPAAVEFVQWLEEEEESGDEEEDSD